MTGDLPAFGMTFLMAVMMFISGRQHEIAHAAGCPSLGTAVPTLGLAVRFAARRHFNQPAQALVIGGRLVSATENALINTLELPLAVAWVWVCFSEIPTGSGLIGGIIVMAAVAAHVWHSSRVSAPAD
jgi:hypothetical protein